MTLYELAEEYRELLAMMEDPEIDPETLADTMEAVGGELEIKAENYVIIMRELEADIEKRKKEIERQQKVISAEDNNIKRLKESLLMAMQSTGKTKFQTDHFRLSVAKNGGVLPVKLTKELKDIPEKYLTYTPKANMDAIREALADGDADAVEIARVEPRGVHLSII